ncbi:hypothetical protein KIN20_024445 [Parelaphostrongylus tenuis]|uniref:Uncharacterized protein n=1 Tax=Parelaphostrongylus tenuis TaxID=148309 RepID=A0AAD5QW00_PARTN|nr:hypothetical protein KIN20_024445 [Parelaphostrongylus tenuis]
MRRTGLLYCRETPAFSDLYEALGRHLHHEKTPPHQLNRQNQRCQRSVASFTRRTDSTLRCRRIHASAGLGPALLLAQRLSSVNKCFQAFGTLGQKPGMEISIEINVSPAAPSVFGMVSAQTPSTLLSRGSNSVEDSVICARRRHYSCSSRMRKP